MIFAKAHRWRFGDIDHAGIAYYPSFFHAFHCAFEDWWSEGLGVDYATLMHEHDLGFPAVRVEADFFAPIRYGDVPEISIGVLRIGASSVEFGFWMTLDAEPRVRSRAKITTVAVSMRTGAKRQVPDAWRTEFGRWLLGEGEFPVRR